jgi:hypothetical protein
MENIQNANVVEQDSPTPLSTELTPEQKKAIAKKMLEKSTRNKINNSKYFEFYDDIKDRTRGHEDW